MFGWQGKILKIDLSTEKIQVINPPLKIYKKFLGGRGLAGYFLKPFIQKPWFAEEMPLLFFTGPLGNTPSPTSGRMTIMSRSPLTDTVGDSSVGGSLGFQIKRAGWDGLIVTGRSPSLVGLQIYNEKVKIVKASSLRQATIKETLKKISLKGSSAVVGPAAENGVLFANIVIDQEFFSGRNGLGLVMASKNLKFLTVEGNQKTEIYDFKKVSEAKEQIFRLVAASPFLKGELGLSEYGTGALYDLMQQRKILPTNNFKESSFEAANKMNAFQYKRRYSPRKYGCWGCHILCKKRSLAGESLPEYETMAHFSALINNKSIATVVKANALCNDLGLDTISSAVTLATFAEINKELLSSSRIFSLLKNIAYGKKEGELLKKGSYRYAVAKGEKEASISVKKLELPAYDPRGVYGMSLSLATSTRGGCHLRSYPIAHEILKKPIATNRFSFLGKAKIIKSAEDLNAVVDSLVACKFIFFAATLEEYALLFSGVTGLKTTAQDLLKIGERIYYQERIMNFLNGFSKKDDDLPDRFFKQGNDKTIPLNRKFFLKARDEYYKIRGLDRLGRPFTKKQKELGL